MRKILSACAMLACALPLFATPASAGGFGAGLGSQTRGSYEFPSATEKRLRAVTVQELERLRDPKTWAPRSTTHYNDYRTVKNDNRCIAEEGGNCDLSSTDASSGSRQTIINGYSSVDNDGERSEIIIGIDTSDTTQDGRQGLYDITCDDCPTSGIDLLAER